MGRSGHLNKGNYKLHHPSHLYISAGLFTLLVYGYCVQPIYCKCYVWKNNNFNMFVQSLVSLEATDVLFHRKNVQNIKQWSEAWMWGGNSPYMKSCKGHGPKIKCCYHVWLYWDEWRTDDHVDSSNAWGGRCNESGKLQDISQGSFKTLHYPMVRIPGVLSESYPSVRWLWGQNCKIVHSCRFDENLSIFIMTKQTLLPLEFKLS